MRRAKQLSAPPRKLVNMMDAVYPEPLFRQLRRTVRKKVHRGPASRYRTQPVTFAEIQEVDEENTEEQSTIDREAAKSERDLHARFHEFWRRNKQEDITSSPAATTDSPIPPPSPPPLQTLSPSSLHAETPSKSLTPSQLNSLSPPIHVLAERKSPSRTSI